MFKALVDWDGGLFYYLGVVQDDRAVIFVVFREDIDVIFIFGGSSVG